MFKLTSLALAGTLMSVCTATAATVSFDLTGGHGASGPAHVFSVDGIGLTVGGKVCRDAGCEGRTYDKDVQHWGNGFGLKSWLLDSHQADGFGWDDMILLTFDTAVRLESLRFSYADGDDHATILRPGPGGGFLTDEKVAIGGSGVADPLGEFEGLSFGVAAVDWNDGWKLAGVDVSAVAPVPLPAAGWMLLAAIGGLCGAGARRGQRAA